MPNLARPQVRLPAPRTKILLVRQPVKSVRKSDEPDRAMFRLAVGVIVALGVVGAVWLMGYLGFRLGFAPAVRVPGLLAEPGEGLATGTLMVISIPHVILKAGMANTGMLMIAFALIAIPGGSLGAIKSATPGGPRRKPIEVVFAHMGAIMAMLTAVALVWWTVSRMRSALVREMPVSPADGGTWLADLQTAGGLDVLAVVVAALWVVVVMRLTIPLWLRGLAASICFFTLVVVTVAMSMTNATVAQVNMPRSVSNVDDAAETPLGTTLVLGETRRHSATLLANEHVTFVELRDDPQTITIIGRQSIIEFLEEHAPREER